MVTAIKLFIQVTVFSALIIIGMIGYALCAETTIQDPKFWGEEMYNQPKAEGYRSYPTEEERAMIEEVEQEELEGNQFSFPVVGKHYKENVSVSGVIIYDGNDMETVHAELVDANTGRAFTAVGTWLTRDELR